MEADTSNPNTGDVWTRSQNVLGLGVSGCHKGHYSHDGAAEDVVVVASATRVIPERDSSLSQTAAIQAFLVVFLPHLRYR